MGPKAIGQLMWLFVAALDDNPDRGQDGKALLWRQNAHSRSNAPFEYHGDRNSCLNCTIEPGKTRACKDNGYIASAASQLTDGVASKDISGMENSERNRVLHMNHVMLGAYPYQGFMMYDSRARRALPLSK